MSDEVFLTRPQAEDLATRACRAVGADEPSTRSLVDATLSAACHGPPALGFPHFVDYLDSFRQGRINASPAPTVQHAFPAFLECDADKGIAQLGFDLAFGAFVEATRSYGVSVLAQRNSYTAGELGYYARRLAGEGLVSIAATNSHAMVVAHAGGTAVYGTNPLAFGFPLGDGLPALAIDQASSATAFVNISAAADANRTIPEGWAVDENGAVTDDPHKALAGALLPFGGRKGANMALMVEMLSAGLSGGSWSLDAPHFRSGNTSPGIGLTIIAMLPGRAQDDRIGRVSQQTRRLQDRAVYMPGLERDDPKRPPELLPIPRSVFETISRIAESG